MWIGIISLFPEMFKAITDFGVTGRAVKQNLLQVHWLESGVISPMISIKPWTYRPYGGGPGMFDDGAAIARCNSRSKNSRL